MNDRRTEPVETCSRCGLVQFRSARMACRRCKRAFEVPGAQLAPVPLAPMPEPELADRADSCDIGLRIAQSVRRFRLLRRMSQGDLAARMDVPRTYLSKIENCRCTPSLATLAKLARALRIPVAELIADAGPAATGERLAAEFAALVPHLTPAQRERFLGYVRELAGENGKANAA